MNIDYECGCYIRDVKPHHQLHHLCDDHAWGSQQPRIERIAMHVAKLTSTAKRAWIIDHCGILSCGEVIAMNDDTVALRMLIGERLLLVRRDECFEMESHAIRYLMHTLSREITTKQNQWAELAARLSPQEAEAS